MNQLELILENIRLSHIEKILLESSTQMEAQRGIDLINESIYTIGVLLQENSNRTSNALSNGAEYGGLAGLSLGAIGNGLTNVDNLSNEGIGTIVGATLLGGGLGAAGGYTASKTNNGGFIPGAATGAGIYGSLGAATGYLAPELVSITSDPVDAAGVVGGVSAGIGGIYGGLGGYGARKSINSNK
jgi:hypothetical protein